MNTEIRGSIMNLKFPLDRIFLYSPVYMFVIQCSTNFTPKTAPEIWICKAIFSIKTLPFTEICNVTLYLLLDEIFITDNEQIFMRFAIKWNYFVIHEFHGHIEKKTVL